MRLKVEHDVLILGGGIAGLSLAHNLAEAGVDCAVVDEAKVGWGASTGNLGVVHGGAMFATAKLYATAESCRIGHQRIKDFVEVNNIPYAIRSNTPCYYLYAEQHERDKLLAACQRLSIVTEAVDTESIREEVLGDLTLFPYAVQVPDFHIDTHVLLSTLVKVALHHGTSFYETSDMRLLAIEEQSGGWLVSLSEVDIKSQILVLACGPYLPEMLRSLIPSHDFGLEVWKSTVLVMQGLRVNSILLMPWPQKGGVHLVPFVQANVGGATVAKLGSDEKVESATDFTLEESKIDTILEATSYYYPGISGMISKGETVYLHAYTAQKLQQRMREKEQPVDRQAIWIDHSDPTNGGKFNLYSFYPGKSTTAMVTAQEYAKRIQTNLEARLAKQGVQGNVSKLPTVARQRYYSTPARILTVERGYLRSKLL